MNGPNHEDGTREGIMLMLIAVVLWYFVIN